MDINNENTAGTNGESAGFNAENNTSYHYVYRRAEQTPPVQDLKPVKKRGGKMWMKLTALILVCTLAGGAAGAGIVSLAERNGSGSASISVSDRTVKDVDLVKVDGTTEMTPAEVYAANVNATVSINVSGTTTNVFGYTTETASAGSGFIITTDGYIVTNYHVIEGANSVKVTLYDGNSYDAAIVGGDEDYDIAVLKIEASGLQAVVIGDSDKLNVGDSAVAIGNPLGELTFSMTEGIVSCVNRAINVDGTPFNMIQIDASINPGNSGGPLLNTYGEVVGIVSAKYSSDSTTSVEGLGFAIPINDVIAMVQDIMENGYVTDKAYMGISAYTVNSQYVQMYSNVLTEGVYVASVDAGGAAEKAGIQKGDIIVKLGDTDITSMSDLTAAKKTYRAGDTVEITVYRSGENKTLSLTFGTQPQTAATSSSTENSATDGSGNSSQNPYQDYYNYFFGNNGSSNGSSGSSYSASGSDAAA